VNAVLNLRVVWSTRNFLTGWETVSLPRKTVLNRAIYLFIYLFIYIARPSVSQLVSQPVSLSASQPASQPVSQSVSQLVRRSKQWILEKRPLCFIRWGCTVNYWNIFCAFFLQISFDSFCRLSDDGFADVTRCHNRFIGVIVSFCVAVLWNFDEAASTWLRVGRMEKGRVALSLYVTAAPLPDQYSVFWRQHPSWRHCKEAAGAESCCWSYNSDYFDPPPCAVTITVPLLQCRVILNG
jgi:hypothetical protein